MTTRERQAVRGIQAASSPARGPVWRALLEAQWRSRLQEVTELSLAYHEAAAVTAAAAADPGQRAELTITRAGQTHTVPVTLGTLPAT